MFDANDSIAVKDMISAASPVIKSLVDTFITPKLVALQNKFSNTNSDNYIPTEENFREYFHRTYKKLSIVNTIVFNNSQRFLKDIYLPLTIRCESQNQLCLIDAYPYDLINDYGYVLITDTAGMGKSTMMKRLFLDIIDQNLGVPLFIELRRLNKGKVILDEIKEQLNSIDKNFNSDLLNDLLKSGDFIILLDGYDEISLADRDIVTKDIQEFISKTSNNSFIITSRPENALASFGNFQEFRINPLSNDEAFELLRKINNNGEISELLINKIQEEHELSSIEEFLTNPLLVSLLYTAFEHRQTIPFKKYLFYRQVYDANFESHDLTKGESYIHDKYSKLEIDDFHRILRHIGFSCFKLQKIEFTKDEILKLITQSRAFAAGLNFKESDFLNDIIKTVPIFTQDGNYYRWAHKSLQEYFAAQYIYLDSKDNQNEILLKIYKSKNIEKFLNVLDLYYDIDYKTFRNTIELELLREYKYYIDTSYQDYSGYNKNEVISRLEVVFLNKPFLFKAEKVNDNTHFDIDLFTEMRENIRKEIDSTNYAYKSITVSPLPVSDIYCLPYQKKNNVILNLFNNKKNPIVKYKIRKYKSLKFNYNFKAQYDYVEVNDNMLNPLNSIENFNNTTLYVEHTKDIFITINHYEALESLKNITDSIEYELQHNFLLGDI